MIKSYYEFINESLISKEEEKNYFYIDKSLEEILRTIKEKDNIITKIATAFLQLNGRSINTTVSLVKLSNSKEYLECLKSKDIINKDEDYSDGSFIEKYENKFFEIKIGRLTRQIIDLYNHTLVSMNVESVSSIDASASDIESFVNGFKSKYDYILSNAKDKIKIVKGDEIKFYYNEENYSKKYGQLAYSCMRYEECEDFFDIYESNDSISMAVMLDTTKKILGRALLFKLNNGDTFMDRIYTSDTSDTLVFIQWAKENRFLYKEKNNSNSSTYIMTPSNNYQNGIKMDLVVKIDKYNLKYKKAYRFPYLDTLKYLYWQTGFLTNVKNPDFGFFVYLEDGDGTSLCNHCDSHGTVECEECETLEWCDNCDEGDMACPQCGGFTYS